MPIADYEQLLDRYKAGLCTDEEIAFVESWYLTYEDGKLSDQLSLSDRESDLNDLRDRLDLSYPKKRVRLWPRLVAAAAIFMILGIGLYFYLNSGSQATSFYTNDIAALNKKTATLTLANGEKILLSEAKTGKLADEAGIQISKTDDGQLLYEIKESSVAKANDWNTLSTTKGEHYTISLPDGTKVWLNNVSSLKYPTSFNALKSRRVELTGEAYFEVAKDKTHPFIVKTAQQTVEVLGTHFNINGYVDENKTTTTLLEGSVKVSSLDGLQSRLIKPGEEVLNVDHQLQVMPANLKESIAWKEGYFRFSNENLESIMRQVARWYDVDIVYAGNRNELAQLTFWGIVSRDKNISEVLKMIERAEKVKFKIAGRTITVMSN